MVKAADIATTAAVLPTSAPDTDQLRNGILDQANNELNRRAVRLTTDPVWGLSSCYPLGLSLTQFVSWWYGAGGERLFNDVADRLFGLRLTLFSMRRIGREPESEPSDSPCPLTEKILSNIDRVSEPHSRRSTPLTPESALNYLAVSGETAMLITDSARNAPSATDRYDSVRLLADSHLLRKKAMIDAHSAAHIESTQLSRAGDTRRQVPLQLRQAFTRAIDAFRAESESFQAIFDSQQSYSNQSFAFTLCQEMIEFSRSSDDWMV